MCTVPEPFPKEFRDDVVNVARGREPGQTIKQIAAQVRFGSEAYRRGRVPIPARFAGHVDL
jgi:hypothetical protein